MAEELQAQDRHLYRFRVREVTRVCRVVHGEVHEETRPAVFGVDSLLHGIYVAGFSTAEDWCFFMQRPLSGLFVFVRRHVVLLEDLGTEATAKPDVRFGLLRVDAGRREPGFSSNAGEKRKGVGRSDREY